MRVGCYLVIAALAMSGLTGCNDAMKSQNPNPATVQIEPSSRSIVAGETVTMVARSRETYGRDAKIRWTSTAGKLTTEQEGRVARVRFDEPGTYTVRAVLSVEGRETESDMVEVRVRPLN